MGRTVDPMTGEIAVTLGVTGEAGGGGGVEADGGVGAEGGRSSQPNVRAAMARVAMTLALLAGARKRPNQGPVRIEILSSDGALAPIVVEKHNTRSSTDES
jgi:hypothetical protein